MENITFRNSDVAFDDAIQAGRLSADAAQANFAGNFMYMGTQGGVDLFKHTNTRQYLPAQAA